MLYFLLTYAIISFKSRLCKTALQKTKGDYVYVKKTVRPQAKAKVRKCLLISLDNGADMENK